MMQTIRVFECRKCGGWMHRTKEKMPPAGEVRADVGECIICNTYTAVDVLFAEIDAVDLRAARRFNPEINGLIDVTGCAQAPGQ